MKLKLIILFFFLPVFFSGSEPPKENDVVQEMQEINQQLIELTNFVKYEMD